MQIVLPGALPDAAIAAELATHIERTAPCFAGWLARARAEIIPAVPADTFCTPYEYWVLRQHGFRPTTQQRASAGLGPLLAREACVPTPNPEAAVWLAQLVHVAPARDGAALIPAGELEIAPQENSALYEAASEYFHGSGFTATPFDDAHWRIDPPPGYEPASPSPTLVSISAVNDWWTQDATGRPWRRLVNELQMLWFDHPINRERETRGLRSVNSLWLYGGGRPVQLGPAPDAAASTLTLRALQGPALVQDWGSWLQALERLDREHFAPLTTQPRVVLTGSDRIVELTPARKGFFASILGGGKQDWRRWWSSRN